MIVRGGGPGVASTWFTGNVHNGVEVTAYLVNESRARCPDLARDPLAREWIPEEGRSAVQDLWDEYARTVYPHDDLVVSLRGRYVLEALEGVLRRAPDALLLVCAAGFSSYPWLLPFRSAVEVDLPSIAETKQRRAAELAAAGVLPRRDVTHLTADLTDPVARQELVDRVRALAAGRPVAYVAEGVVFYLPEEAAHAVVNLGASFADQALTLVTYWPRTATDNPVLAAQRRWFRRRSVPEEATYLAGEELPAEIVSPEELQRRYLGEVMVPERDLVPEYIMVGGR